MADRDHFRKLICEKQFPVALQKSDVQITTSGVLSQRPCHIRGGKGGGRRGGQGGGREVGGGGLVGWHCTVVILHTSHPVVRLTAGPVTLSHCAFVPALRRLPLSSNTRDKSQL